MYVYEPLVYVKLQDILYMPKTLEGPQEERKEDSSCRLRGSSLLGKSTQVDNTSNYRPYLLFEVFLNPHMLQKLLLTKNYIPINFRRRFFQHLIKFLHCLNNESYNRNFLFRNLFQA